ncbi:hypothetical protein LDENG_00197270 [Lucifuga dentata]|nr:hypothetical protein LDENG_00197270 [Lucifuga dentata]
MGTGLDRTVKPCSGWYIRLSAPSDLPFQPCRTLLQEVHDQDSQHQNRLRPPWTQTVQAAGQEVSAATGQGARRI